MTVNQIAYWNLQEQKQHNRTTEAETYRHNVETEKLTARQIDATYANIALGYANLAETTRSHRANEALSAIQIASNYAISFANLGVAERNADTNALNAKTRQQELEQTKWWQSNENTRQWIDTARGVVDTGTKSVQNVVNTMTSPFQNLPSMVEKESQKWLEKNTTGKDTSGLNINYKTPKYDNPVMNWFFPQTEFEFSINKMKD